MAVLKIGGATLNIGAGKLSIGANEEETCLLESVQVIGEMGIAAAYSLSETGDAWMTVIGDTNNFSVDPGSEGWTEIPGLALPAFNEKEYKGTSLSSGSLLLTTGDPDQHFFSATIRTLDPECVADEGLDNLIDRLWHEEHPDEP